MTAALVSDIDAARKLKQLMRYVKYGWHIFPCYEPAPGGCSCGDPECGNAGKHPRISGGFNAASNEEKKVRKWNERWPNANWAVACGASGLAVVDIDPRNGGDDTLAELEQKHGALPDTVRANTGGGGQHYYLDGAVATTILGDGVDLKSRGGYVIIPPSLHASGTRYTWDAGSPDGFAITPDWIRGRAQETKHEHLSVGAVEEGWLGAAFAAAGWLGRPLVGGKATAQCPWEHEHTSGKRHDSSTVIFAPYPNSRLGAYYCSHSHCNKRRIREIIEVLPEAAKEKATQVTGVDPASMHIGKLHHQPLEEAVPGDVAWRDSLRMHNDGVRITRDVGNLALLLANMPQWAGTLSYDAFASRAMWTRPVPEIPGLEASAPSPGDALGDVHLTYIRHWLAKSWGVTMGKDAVGEAAEAAARANTYHPLRDYLQGLEWDHRMRAARWLHTYMLAPDEPYVHACGRWWLISAVARALQPGCQVDHTLVLEGMRQGEGKSSALAILGGEWYLGALPDIRDKDAKDALRGRWIIEIGEMDVFRRAEASRVKDFLSQRTDRFRPAYGRYQIESPRSCVFAGTTNEESYLVDPTGARRFWPVRVRGARLEQLAEDRDQLWAEAVHYYRCGEHWWPDRRMSREISQAQDERYRVDAWEDRILNWIRGREGLDALEVTMDDLLGKALMIEPGRWTRSDQTRVGAIMRKAGWLSMRHGKGENRRTVYGRAVSDEDEEL